MLGGYRIADICRDSIFAERMEGVLGWRVDAHLRIFCYRWIILAWVFSLAVEAVSSRGLVTFVDSESLGDGRRAQLLSYTLGPVGYLARRVLAGHRIGSFITRTHF